MPPAEQLERRRGRKALDAAVPDGRSHDRLRASARRRAAYAELRSPAAGNAALVLPPTTIARWGVAGRRVASGEQFLAARSQRLVHELGARRDG